jgi:2-C-methyl-D-erythritol 2,4-cyclodiphosphate synthase
MRIGHGFDAHRFGEGQRLVLGGVDIPSDRALEGHSDADVLIHAIIDASLGAAALGDIGQHFPSGDERWRDASSIDMLRTVARMVREGGSRVVNTDTTIVAEVPRLTPHVAAMRANIASALEIDVAAVSVKPKTSDGMGFTGRGEGIAAFAVVLLE